MRRNFSRGKNSAPLVSGHKQMMPQNSQIPDLATVQDRCKELWAQVIAKITAIRDDFDKYCPGESSAAGNRTNEDLPFWRTRMTFMKRIGSLMRSAQSGYFSVCASQIQLEARFKCSWEMTKRKMDPKKRAEMENDVSRALDRPDALSSGESGKRLDKKERSHIDQQGHAGVHPNVSRTRAILEVPIRFWADELAHLDSIVWNLDKRHADTKSQEPVSDRKIISSLRNRTTMMKQTIRILSQAQEGLLSGFTAVGILVANWETSSPGTMKISEDNLLREMMEKHWCIAYEVRRTFGIPISEIHDPCDENSKSPRNV